MLKKTLIAAAIAAGLAGAAPTFAQPPQPQPGQSQAGPPAVPPRAYGYQLMTPEERDAYRKQMQEAKTPEERATLRNAHRAEMQKRAQEKGVTLPAPRGPGGGPRGGGGARQSQLYGDELFTPAERQAFFDKMKAATTPEERRTLILERRATAEARAKEKGITLPPPRGPGGPGTGPGAGMAPGSPRGLGAPKAQ